MSLNKKKSYFTTVAVGLHLWLLNGKFLYYTLKKYVITRVFFF